MPELSIMGYVDTYYCYDNAKLPPPEENALNSRQLTFLNPKKEQFGLNLAMISVSAENDYFRGKVSLHNGHLATAAWDNYVLNPNVQEAYAGFQIFDKFWVDAGYYLTHIGGESVLPKDNWLTSHSMVTYFEPFYQAGLRFSYQVTPNFSAQLHILNGNALFEDNNDLKSIGWKLEYVGNNDKYVFSYAGIAGNELAGEPRDTKFHILNNVCFLYNISNNIEAKAQFDYSLLEDAIEKDGKPEQGKVMAFSFQGRYKVYEKLYATGRFSYFDNTDDMYQLKTPKTTGMGFTAGIEFKPVKNGYIRLESRTIVLDKGNIEDGTNGLIFKISDNKYSNNRKEVWLNFGLWVN